MGSKAREKFLVAIFYFSQSISIISTSPPMNWLGMKYCLSRNLPPIKMSRLAKKYGLLGNLPLIKMNQLAKKYCLSGNLPPIKMNRLAKKYGLSGNLPLMMKKNDEAQDVEQEVDFEYMTPEEHKFKMVEILGEGSFGVCWKVMHTPSHVFYAAKYFKKEVYDSQLFMIDFVRYLIFNCICTHNFCS
jgi:hypothetical protein